MLSIYLYSLKNPNNNLRILIRILLHLTYLRNTVPGQSSTFCLLNKIVTLKLCLLRIDPLFLTCYIDFFVFLLLFDSVSIFDVLRRTSRLSCFPSPTAIILNLRVSPQGTLTLCLKTPTPWPTDSR